MTKYLAAAMLALILPLQAAEPPAKASSNSLPPDVLAQRTGDELLRRIKKNQRIYKEDAAQLYAMVDEVVLPHFDFNYMAKLVLARNWLDADDSQRKRFEDAFRDLLIRTYGNALLEYGDEVIVWESLDLPADSEKVVVKSSIKSPGSSAIAMDYRMRKADTGWKVYDISVDGISLVTNYRGTYNSEIKRNGLNALIKRLEQKSAG